MKSMPYTTKSDVWSMGLIYYEMLYGRTPWPCNSLEQLVASTWRTPVSFPATIKVSKES
jgi:serine/threonine protein kinase